MQDYKFSREMTELLLSPEKWQFVTRHTYGSPLERHDTDTREKQFRFHKSREILMAVSGSYVLGFNGKFYEARPGTVFLIDSNLSHEYYYTADASELIHIWVHVGPEKSLIVCDWVDQLKCAMPVKKAVSITSEININQFWDEYNNAVTAFEQFCALQKIRMALGLAFSGLLLTPTYADRELQLQNTVESARQYILKNYRRGINVEQLARNSSYSRFHFVRMFKKFTGCTIHEYINACRINEAERLKNLGRSQKEIAKELGFSCQSAYCSWRKKIMLKETGNINSEH